MSDAIHEDASSGAASDQDAGSERPDGSGAAAAPRKPAKRTSAPGKQAGPKPAKRPAAKSPKSPKSPKRRRAAAAPPPASPAAHLLTELEQQLAMRVVVYWARGPMTRSEARTMYQLLAAIGQQERLAIVMQSPGGDADAAHHLASLTREFVSELHVYVPTYAASAATLFCLNADVLWMGPSSELSPIDPQVPVDSKLLLPAADADFTGRGLQDVVHIPARVIRDFLELTGVLESGRDRPHLHIEKLESILRPLNPWILGWYERADKVSRVYAHEALLSHLLKNDKQAEKKSTQIVEYLLDHYASHDASISRGEARRIGLPVRDCPAKVWDCLERMTQFYDAALSRQKLGRILDTTAGFEAVPATPQNHCIGCGQMFDYDHSHRFCPYCGVGLGRQCVNCSTGLAADWVHCPRCGAQQQEIPSSV